MLNNVHNMPDKLRTIYLIKCKYTRTNYNERSLILKIFNQIHQNVYKLNYLNEAQQTYA